MKMNCTANGYMSKPDEIGNYFAVRLPPYKGNVTYFVK